MKKLLFLSSVLFTFSASAQTFIDLTAIARGTATANQVLISNGSNRVVFTGINNLISGGTGISVNASGVVTNTSPDQTVVLTAGTGINITGTYPNFTIANTVSATPFQTLATAGTTSPTVTLSDGGGTVTFASGTGGGWSRSGNTLTYTPTVNAYQTFSHSGNTSTLSNGGGIISVVGTGAATVSQSAGVYTVSVPAASAPLYTTREPFAVASNIAIGGTFTTTGVTLPSSMDNFFVFLDGSLLDARDGGADTDWDYERTGASQLTFNRAINSGSKLLIVY